MKKLLIGICSIMMVINLTACSESNKNTNYDTSLLKNVKTLTGAVKDFVTEKERKAEKAEEEVQKKAAEEAAKQKAEEEAAAQEAIDKEAAAQEAANQAQENTRNEGSNRVECSAAIAKQYMGQSINNFMAACGTYVQGSNNYGMMIYNFGSFTITTDKNGVITSVN